MKRKDKICRVIAAMLITVMVTISLSGCGGKNTKSSIPSGTAANEILTLTPVDQNKEMVTIHFEYGLNIAGALEQTIADLKSKHQNVISEIYQLGKNITAL